MISYAFPDYDAATLPPIPSDWRDVSYKNDTCPSWIINELQVFIDFADPDAREVAGPRFHILDQTTGDGLLSTNAWPDVLNFVHMSRLTLPTIEPDQDEDQLIQVFTKFLCETGLPAQSADELIFHDIPWNVRRWLTRFIEVWDAMREDEQDWMAYAEQKAGIK